MKLTRKAVVFFLVMMLCVALSGCGKSETVKATEEAIKAIGEVTLDSDKLISAAEKAYDALEEKERKQVEGAELIQEAREKYNDLVDGMIESGANK